MRKELSLSAELICASKFARKGYDIFLPLGEPKNIDFITYKNGQFRRIQIKTTKPKNGKLRVKLRSTNNWQNRKYTKEDVDFIVTYDYKNDEMYILDMQEFDGMSEVTLRLEPTKNKQIKGVRLAEQFRFK